MTGPEAGNEDDAAADDDRERFELLQDLDDRLETPMVILGLAWLVLLVVELVWGLGPVLEAVGTVIWVVFLVDFAVKVTLAPNRAAYLQRNWLTAIALVAPALRVLRFTRVFSIVRAARAARGLRLVKVVGSANRGMKALGGAMSRRGFGYVMALTTVVTLVGAAGMYAFENQNVDGRGLHDYGAALWWTAMIMTTMGSEYWPQTAEGRALCFFLSVYAFAVFGYVTATLATFFIGRDAAGDEGRTGAASSVESLRLELRAMREELAALARQRDP